MPFFGPLAKLGLSVYLVHPTILLMRIFDSMRLPTYTMAGVVGDWISCVVFSYGAEMAAFLIIEHPCSTLVKELMAKVRS